MRNVKRKPRAKRETQNASAKCKAKQETQNASAKCKAQDDVLLGFRKTVSFPASVGFYIARTVTRD